jgi:alkanesulfonate monooxygenase SsuD/methylene tetrahydromethanopterin reductase-like flavin-dependent oxidoreductase (luciferase family)
VLCNDEDALNDELTVGVSINNLAGDYTLHDLLDFAREAEDLGFDAVWLHDAPLGRRTLAAWDTPSVLSALAQVTSRIKLCTGIFQPHLRNPVTVAQAWATADYLSGGRTIMGVGTGAGKSRLVEREYDAAAALRPGNAIDHGELYRKRRRLFLECIEVIRRLWDEDHVTFHGEFYHLDDVTLGLAKPAAKPHPPIVIGAGHYIPSVYGGSLHHIWNEDRAGKWLPGTIEEVGRLGDGWITVQLPPEDYSPVRDRVLASRPPERAGDPFILAFNCFVNVNDDRRTAWEEVRQQLNDFHGPPVPDDMVDSWAVPGPGEVIAERLSRYADQGVRLFQLVIGSRDERGQMRRLAKEMLPALRG